MELEKSQSRYNQPMNDLHLRPARESDFEALVPLMKGFATTRENGLQQRLTRILQNPDMACLEPSLKG